MCLYLGVTLCAPVYEESAHMTEHESNKYSDGRGHHNEHEYVKEKAGKDVEHGG